MRFWNLILKLAIHNLLTIALHQSSNKLFSPNRSTVFPKIFMEHIRTILIRNTHTNFCELNAIEIDEREKADIVR